MLKNQKLFFVLCSLVLMGSAVYQAYTGHGDPIQTSHGALLLLILSKMDK